MRRRDTGLLFAVQLRTGSTRVIEIQPRLLRRIGQRLRSAVCEDVSPNGER